MRYLKDRKIWEHAPGRRLAEAVIRIRNEKGPSPGAARLLATAA